MHKDRIIALAKEGKTFREIQQELNCSLSTISYHLSEGQKEKNVARRRQTREKYRERLREIKRSTPCADCKQIYPPYVMHFDHLPGIQKLGHVSEMVRNSTLEKTLEEVEKCEVVCANCHAERTYRRTTPA